MAAEPASISARRSSRERTQQGPQDADGPAVRYRKALAALDQYCRKEKSGAFASLSDADKDAVIGGLESGAVKLDGVDGQAFFERARKHARRIFADPIYGGNRDMCAWRMIGYPAPGTTTATGSNVTTSAIPIRP